MVNQAEDRPSRGDKSLSPDGRCVVQDKGFYLCQAMDKWLGDSVVNQKGRNRIYLATNLETFEDRYRGIVAHIPKTNGVLIRFCPFCGSDKVLNYPEEEVKDA